MDDVASFGHDGIVKRLLALDDAVQGLIKNGDVPIVVVGGAALILQGLTRPDRLTSIIDFIEAPMEAIGRMGGLDMNNAAATFSLMMPYGWRERVQTIPTQTSAIRVETPSAADLCIMKLTSGRDRDLADVLSALEMRPDLRTQISTILSDPLELQVNVSEVDWDRIRESAAALGIP